MAKKKEKQEETLRRETINLIPMREEVPVGALFQFIGKKNVYRVCLSNNQSSLACEMCALRDSKKSDQCTSSICTPSFRKDKNFVYFEKVQ